jgi:predicted glutamine amidotransferase
VSQTAESAVEGLGVAEFQSFTSLSAVHGDGWGMAWSRPGGSEIEVATSPMSAADDPRYFGLAGQALGAAGLVHLRWATDGLAVHPMNTHPFTDGTYELAHNGSISPIGTLDGMLSDASRARLKGTTDSERYFALVLQCIESDGDERAGLLRAVGTLHEHFPSASLNALFLTPTHLYAVHVNSRATTPLDDLRELFGSEDAMPHGHASAYFDMAYKASPTAVHVISSGLPDEGWTPVPSDSILAINLTTREIEVLDPRAVPSAQ